MFFALPTAICFVVCHGGPADHFSTFATELAKKGYDVKVYATGPALKKIQDKKFEGVIPFSLENKDVASSIAQECANAAVVITDVGHVFDVSLQEALRDHAPKVKRFAYYDNPEPYVPGGYSMVAAQVVNVAQRILFANANLAKEKDLFPSKDKVGIGYYPVDQAKKIGKRRQNERASLRADLFFDMAWKIAGKRFWCMLGEITRSIFQKRFQRFSNI